MSKDILDAAVLSIIRVAGRPLGLNWIEIRVWADHFDPDTIYRAPDTFDVRDSIRRLEAAGLVKHTDRFQWVPA